MALVPKGLLETIIDILSHGLISNVFSIIAVLCAIGILFDVYDKSPLLFLILLPVVTSFCGTILWVVMWVGCNLLSFLSVPAVEVWMLVVPSIFAAVLHIPALVIHKSIDDSMHHKEDSKQ